MPEEGAGGGSRTTPSASDASISTNNAMPASLSAVSARRQWGHAEVFTTATAGFALATIAACVANGAWDAVVRRRARAMRVTTISGRRRQPGASRWRTPRALDARCVASKTRARGSTCRGTTAAVDIPRVVSRARGEVGRLTTLQAGDDEDSPSSLYIFFVVAYLLMFPWQKTSRAIVQRAGFARARAELPRRLAAARARPAPEPPARDGARDDSKDFYQVKRVSFFGRKDVPIIGQNENGPCPLLAIANVLLLRNAIALEGSPDRPEVSTAELMSLLAARLLDVNDKSTSDDEMVRQNQEQNLNDAVVVLPAAATGLDVNVRFRHPLDFEFTAELAVFDLLDVTLCHAWVAGLEHVAARDAIRALVQPAHGAACRAGDGGGGGCGGGDQTFGRSTRAVCDANERPERFERPERSERRTRRTRRRRRGGRGPARGAGVVSGRRGYENRPVVADQPDVARGVGGARRGGGGGGRGGVRRGGELFLAARRRRAHTETETETTRERNRNRKRPAAGGTPDAASGSCSTRFWNPRRRS